MPEASSHTPTWSVIVSSCDAYSDLWPFFFHFLQKRWPDVRRPVNLVANFNRYDSPWVRTLAVGADESWGETISRALEQMEEEFVVFLLDDFFLDTQVPAGWLDALVAQLAQAGGDFLSLYKVGRPADDPSRPLISQVMGRIDCPGFHAAIFRRSYLQELAAARQNIWVTESRMRDHCEARPGTQFNLAQGAAYRLTYVESVRGQFWKPNGVEYLRANGLRPDLRRRPCPPQGQGPLAKIIRSYHKRRMRWRAQRAAAAPGQVIAPLNPPAG
jgi:hypothetical protein